MIAFRPVVSAVIVALCLAASYAAPSCFAQETGVSASLTPATRICPPTEQYSAKNRPFQGIPSIAASRGGLLWVTWYGGTGENLDDYVMLAYSADLGETWSDVLFVLDWPGSVRVYDPGIWTDPNGRLWLFWAQSNGENNDGRYGVWSIATDTPERGADAVWFEPRRLCNGIMMEKPIVDRKGRWLFPASQRAGESSVSFQLDPAVFGACAYVSTDEGETLDLLGRVARPDGDRADEHTIVELKDGSLKTYARAKHGVWESVSTDGGLTWSRAVMSPSIVNTSSRFFVRRLKSGSLLLVKNGPIDQDVDRSQMTAFISTDDGKSWQGGLVLDERDDVSYPDGDQTEDGTIVVTYDRDRGGAAEILCARFTEKDVLAKKIVSKVGKLKLLVNKSGAK